MTKKDENKKQKKEEVAREMNAKDMAWELFTKTKDINYYRLYSALKEEKK